MGKDKKPRKKRIKQLQEEYLQARDLSASDENHLAIRSFMGYFGKWKILVTLLAVFGFALGIFVVVDRIFFHEASPEPYMHEFAADNIGFKKPAKVLMVNSPERRQMVKDAVDAGLIVNRFNLDSLKDEGLYLMKYDKLGLYTTVRKSNINTMVLEPLAEPEVNKDPLLTLDAMAYFGPRALQIIKTQAMLDRLLEAENVLSGSKDELMINGMLSLNSSGTMSVYKPEDIELDFEGILSIEEGLPYFKAQVDINNPNAEELLKEYQKQN